MPLLFSFGQYKVYFWSNENIPREPIHVHVAEGRPTENATKIWISRQGKTVVCHNRSNIPEPRLRLICRAIEANAEDIIMHWQKHFGEMTFYC